MRRFWIVAAASVCVVWMTYRRTAPRLSEIEVGVELTAGTAFTATLTADTVYSYRVNLEAGEGMDLRLEQQGLDIVAEVVGPKGVVTLEVDSPLGDTGPERVCFVSDRGGDYRLRVRGRAGAAGDYRLVVEARRSATAADRDCFAALRAFTAASRELRQAGPSSELASAFDRAQVLWRRSGHRLPRALALQYQGWVWKRLGDRQREARAYDDALELLQDLGVPHLEVNLLNRLGSAMRVTGRPRDAAAAFEQALQLADANGNLRGRAEALNNLAVLDRVRGELYRSLERYHQALMLWQQLGEDHRSATTLFNLGVNLTVLGRFQAAQDRLTEALALEREFGDKASQALVLSAIGWVHYQTDDFEMAIACYREALVLARAVHASAREAEALDRLATVYRSDGRLEEAMTTYRRALRLAEENGNLRDASHTRINIGTVLLDQGRASAARAVLERALEVVQRLDDVDGLAAILVALARVEQLSGDLHAALRRAEEFVNISRSMRSVARRHGARERPHAFNLRGTEIYIDVLMDLHRSEPEAGYAARALEASEMTRARNLYEMLLEAEINPRSSADPTLLARERDVRLRLDQAEEERLDLLSVGPTPSSEAAELASLQIRELVSEYEEIRAEIRRADPRFAALVDPQLLNLAELQEQLPEGSRLLSYVLGEHRSFVFLISADDIVSRQLPGREVIERLAVSTYEGLRQSRHRRAQRQEWLVSMALSEAILAPVLADVDRGGRLVVVAEGGLHYVPFAALPLPGNQPGEAKQRRLLDVYEVVQVPSASVLVTLRQREAKRQPAPQTLAIVADPVFSASDPRVSAASAIESPASPAPEGIDEVSEVLVRLPNTLLEARAIRALGASLDPLLLTGFEANRERIRSGTLASYRIIHFATHAVIDEQYPALSGITLSMVDEAGRYHRNGTLRLHDLYNLDLPADLVILSACRTALGGKIRGEGLIGLAHGFFYAGATRLVVSFWDVADVATAALMTEFYRGLLTHRESPAAALRSAQLQIRANPRWQAPYYWAGFHVQGSW